MLGQVTVVHHPICPGERRRKIIKHQEGADPGAVIFDAIKAAKARKVDLLICDTAGRLHNKANLMNELGKVFKIVDREFPEAKREVLLVVDATTGQNAVSQAKTFKEVADITGIVLTKLDGTAKGGIVLAIREEIKLPVKFIGLGEGMDDLKSFIGIITELEEDDKGLKFTAKFDDTPEAQRIRQLYKDGRLSKFSFAYDTIDSATVTLEDGTKANELRELDIFEISAVLVPANSFAEVVDIKSGKRNSTADEATIRNAITLLQELLGEVVDNNDSSENDADDNAAAKDQGVVNEKAEKLLALISQIETK